MVELETRGYFRRLLLAAGDAHRRLLLPAPRRALDHQRPDFLDPDETQPEIQITFLMVEAGPRRRRILGVGAAPRVDHQGARNGEQRPVLPAVEGEEHVALADQINQLLELVRISEIPHRYADDEPI